MKITYPLRKRAVRVLLAAFPGYIETDDAVPHARVERVYDISRRADPDRFGEVSPEEMSYDFVRRIQLLIPPGESVADRRRSLAANREGLMEIWREVRKAGLIEAVRKAIDISYATLYRIETGHKYAARPPGVAVGSDAAHCAEVLRCIRDAGAEGLGLREIMDLAGGTHVQVKQSLRALLDDEQIVPRGETRGRRYYLGGTCQERAS